MASPPTTSLTTRSDAGEPPAVALRWTGDRRHRPRDPGAILIPRVTGRGRCPAGREAGHPLYDHVAQNNRRSLLLTVVFVVVVTVVVAAVLQLFDLGLIGVVIGLVVAVATALAAHRWSESVVLRVSRAVPADPVDHARLHNLVDGLCMASGLPKPSIHVIDDAAPNALAAGRNQKRAAIAVTTGLLASMNRVELEAVLAHELGHVKDGDLQASTLAVTLAGSPTLLADLLVRLRWWNGGRRDRDDRTGGTAPWAGAVGVMILRLSPLLSRLLRAAIGPPQAASADLSAIELTRYPPGLIAALEKLRDSSTVVHAGTRATAHLWMECPLALTDEEGELSRWNRMYDTHPPIEERIDSLRER